MFTGTVGTAFRASPCPDARVVIVEFELRVNRSSESKVQSWRGAVSNKVEGNMRSRMARDSQRSEDAFHESEWRVGATSREPRSCIVSTLTASNQLNCRSIHRTVADAAVSSSKRIGWGLI